MIYLYRKHKLNYRSSAYLPGGASATETPETIPRSTYSFREDYEKVDLAAKSMFYVETYDNTSKAKEKLWIHSESKDVNAPSPNGN